MRGGTLQLHQPEVYTSSVLSHFNFYTETVSTCSRTERVHWPSNRPPRPPHPERWIASFKQCNINWTKSMWLHKLNNTHGFAWHLYMNIHRVLYSKCFYILWFLYITLDHILSCIVILLCLYCSSSVWSCFRMVTNKNAIVHITTTINPLHLSTYPNQRFQFSVFNKFANKFTLTLCILGQKGVFNQSITLYSIQKTEVIWILSKHTVLWVELYDVIIMSCCCNSCFWPVGGSTTSQHHITKKEAMIHIMHFFTFLCPKIYSGKKTKQCCEWTKLN